MKAKIFALGLMATLSLSACSEFLTELPETVVAKESFYKTEADFEQANIGIYQILRSLYGAGAANYGAWQMGEMRSDNTTFQYNLENRGYSDREYIATFMDDANSGAVGTKYNNTYYMIQRANQVIEFIEGAEISQQAHDNYKGQALFLRALGYFDLVQYFGDVPLVTVAPTTYEQAMVGRTPKADVYKQIIADVTEAAQLLPSPSAQKKGYANSGSAWMLLGNVNIVLGNWADAEKALLNVKGFSLMSDYAAIYDPANKNNAESIFEIQYWDDRTAGCQSDFAYNFLPILPDPGVIAGFPSGSTNNYAGWNMPTPEMIAAYEDGDKRKDASIAWYTYPGDNKNYGGLTFPYVKKYVHGAEQAGYCNEDFPVYRYAETLLFLAEACNEQGRTAEALAYLNQVHAHPRTGLKPLTASSQSSLRQLIQDERRVELAFENKRWLDLVRTGKAVEVMSAFGKSVKADPEKYYYPHNVFPPSDSYQVDEHRLLFPIPQREIRLNPDGMVQNPGYR
ncbi:MAG: RagB/SusD family nutrient uptake outer membrane protein [Bacteroidales bacterium]|nr:RagB/SusD family nutrient uptake outer membrane protein [Bacteroidales bacterium]